MKIVILGTRGIPNNYGGFEQCAEFLSVGLVKKVIQLLFTHHLFTLLKSNFIKVFKLLKKIVRKIFLANQLQILFMIIYV